MGYGPWYPAVTNPNDVPMLRIKYPKAVCTEVCSVCEQEIDVPAYERSKCPKCGAAILPCGMCCTYDGGKFYEATCFDKCPYE